jgi:hypothetical protein
MAKCPSCQNDLPENNNAGQCPHCGHGLIGVQLGGEGTLEISKVEVGYGAQKSWLEQWGQVERSYKKVQSLYTGPVDNQEATTLVKDFFAHSWHLSDWLAKDTATSVQKRDIGTLLQSEPDLKICNAIANTSKHYSRGENAMSARVSSVVTKPQGQITIEISTTGGTKKRDALELATNCMSIWRNFLKFNKLMD